MTDDQIERLADRLIELADKRAAEKREQERVDQAKRDACARYGHGPFIRERCVMCGEGA